MPETKKPDLGAAGPPRFLITIDTEGDNLWAAPKTVTTRNSQFIPRFQGLCESYGFKPTYLTDYEMARCPCFLEFAHDLLRRNAGEIGMHLHAWDTPPIVPLTDNDLVHQPYLMEYPKNVIEEKVRFMTDLLESTFGRKMVSHRAGRWGFNETYAQVLAAHGYRVDCSVTPLKSWKAQKGDPRGEGGPDFTYFQDHAYFLNLSDISKKGDSPLLELPLTVVRLHGHLGALVQRVCRHGPRLLRSFANRLFPPFAQFRPQRGNLGIMLRILRHVAQRRLPYIEFMLHSSEFMPGGSPTFRTEQDINALYEDLDGLFSEARSSGFSGATLEEYWQDAVKAVETRQAAI